MGRTRLIGPRFFKDEDLADVSISARYLFSGLWTVADREGRLEYRPKLIKAEVFPHDAIDATPLLDELVRGGFVIPYEVEGRAYLWIRSFTRYQHPHQNEARSTLPPPPASEAPAGSPANSHIRDVDGSPSDIGRSARAVYGVRDTVTGEPPPAPPAGVEPAELPSGQALVLRDQLAAEFIAAGGVADRAWKRRALGELTSRGLEAGRRVVEGWIETAREERDQVARDAAWAGRRAEAIAWVRERGGAAVVARSAVDWLSRNRLEGETDEAAMSRWAAEPGVPEMVLNEIKGVLFTEHRILARTG
jgi:hypothetical protein